VKKHQEVPRMNSRDDLRHNRKNISPNNHRSISPNPHRNISPQYHHNHHHNHHHRSISPIHRRNYSPNRNRDRFDVSPVSGRSPRRKTGSRLSFRDDDEFIDDNVINNKRRQNPNSPPPKQRNREPMRRDDYDKSTDSIRSMIRAVSLSSLDRNEKKSDRPSRNRDDNDDGFRQYGQKNEKFSEREIITILYII
jgi:hypothetical protein